jgi:vitamin B12 transporter
MKALLFAATVVAAVTPAAIAAAEVAPSNAIVVTATRTAQTVDEALAAVTVITRNDIERSQAQSVPELLMGLAGLDANVSGGYGKTTGFFLRGTNSDHMVVLVDGVRIGSATSGTVSWEYLPVDQIERIEVVRGPRSSLYGADAIGGVVQIFTRRGQDALRANASAGYGTHNSREYSANVSGTSSGTHVSVAANRFETNGINAKKESVANEPDSDGYRNDSFSSRVGHRFGGGAEIEAHLLHAQGHSHYDGSWSNESEFTQNTVGAEARFTPVDIWNVKLQVARSRDESEDYLDGAYASTYNTSRVTQLWQNDVLLAKRQLLTLGADRQRDSVESSTEFSNTLRHNTGYFMQHQAGFGAHDLLAGLRRDDNQAYGVHHTGNLGWGYALVGERLRLNLTGGTAFKAPTFNQLYDPWVGNAEINPEKSKSAELALQGRENWGKWAVRTYRTEVTDLIVFQPPTYQALNISRARIRGIESEIAVASDGNSAALNVTALDPRDVETGHLLPRRAQRSLRLDLDGRFGSFHAGLQWLVQGYRFDDPENARRLGGYALVNIHARYDFTRNWFVRARTDNVFDKEYETAADYNSLGRSYFVSLGYQVR